MRSYYPGKLNVMEEADDLLLWQRACFMEDDAPRSKADSLRLRISHLQSTYHSKNDDGSPQVLQLLKFHLNQYSSIIDDQDPITGLNSYNESIQSLTAGTVSRSNEWESSLTADDVASMLNISNNEKFQDVAFPITNKVLSISRPHPQPLPQASTSAAIVKSCDNHVTSKSVMTTKRFLYKAPNGAASGMLGGNKISNGRVCPKRSRQSDSEESEGEESESKGCGQDFITAKDQYIINNHKKKYGNREGEKGGGRGGDYNPIDYGSNKSKSLGTRRGTGSKFIPPVKKSDNITDDVVCNTSSNKASGSGSSSLPPHLEGNEKLKNIDPRMVELIINEIMDHGVKIDWDDIAGLDFAKSTIKEIVVWPMMRPDIFKGLRGPPKGILLFGPPGTGKTLIGKCIASQVNATFFSISASSLTSKWVGEGEKMVRALFAVARCFQPAVVFIDEIDSLLSQRSDSEHESSRRIKTEFLVQLDGATTNPDDKLLLIGATNRPQEIDEAARRRLVKRLYIPLPDSSARRQIITNLLRDHPSLLTQDELHKLCQLSHGYSGADMANLCREAALGPIRDAAHCIQDISPDDVRAVAYSDFEDAITTVRPSVSENDLQVYLDWNEKYGCATTKTKKS